LRDHRTVGRVDIGELAWAADKLPVHIILEKLRRGCHSFSNYTEERRESSTNIILN
jgi:hypothetical protein